MPPTTRRQKRIIGVLQDIANEARPSYDSDDGYDSDECLTQSMAKRVSSKLRSAIRASWFELEDEDENWPHDQKHDLTTVEPTLEALAEFLVEVEEAMIWWREIEMLQIALAHGSDARTDVDLLCSIFRDLMKEDDNIGQRCLLELKLCVDTYVALYRYLTKHRAVLDTTLVVRRRRSLSAAEGRATRCVPTQQTTGEALVVRLEQLKKSLDAALVRCGERV